jgi:hypothetical protein
MRSILAAVTGLMLAVGSNAVGQDSPPKSEPQKKAPITTPSPTAADAKPANDLKAPTDPSAKAAPKQDQPTADVYVVALADVRDWRGLAKRLEVMGEAELLPTAAVWRAFAADAKAAVKRLARAAQSDPSDQRVVLDALNAWIAARTSAADAALRADNVRDVELQALLKKAELVPAESRRLNRLLVDSMFPLELAQRPLLIAGSDAGATSRYPPNRRPEVTLSLTVPRLRGRLNVFLPDGQTLTFIGDKPVTVKAPNDGVLRFAITGDGYDRPFAREITWNPDEVKDGVVERTLGLFGGRR